MNLRGVRATTRDFGFKLLFISLGRVVENFCLMYNCNEDLSNLVSFIIFNVYFIYNL